MSNPLIRLIFEPSLECVSYTQSLGASQTYRQIIFISFTFSASWLDSGFQTSICVLIMTQSPSRTECARALVEWIQTPIGQEPHYRGTEAAADSHENTESLG